MFLSDIFNAELPGELNPLGFTFSVGCLTFQLIMRHKFSTFWSFDTFNSLKEVLAQFIEVHFMPNS